METKAKLLERVPTGYALLRDERDFKWYKAGLDVAGKQHYRHLGEPVGYPCAATGVWSYDSQYQDDCYDHTFMYPKSTPTKCEHCGNSTASWTWEFEL